MKPKEIKCCPFGCGGKVELKIHDTTYATSGSVFKGKRWLYSCGKCKESFTTTESDTLSIEQFKPKNK